MKNKPTRMSLSSKWKTFRILHPNGVLGIICAVFAIIALTLITVVGTIAGWDIGKSLRSPTALLVYTVLFIIAVVVVFKQILFKRW